MAMNLAAVRKGMLQLTSCLIVHVYSNDITLDSYISLQMKLKLMFAKLKYNIKYKLYAFMNKSL